MDTKYEALKFFRKAVSFLYREIGVLDSHSHPEITSKAVLASKFFGQDRKKIAKEIYHKTKTEEDTKQILQPYEYRTGLTLEDIHMVFKEGQLPRGFGGPRWAEIAKTIIELRQLIDAQEWNKTPSLIEYAKTLRHNHGLFIDKFKELEW